MMIAGIHAEAYPSGEFRHGPLSMIDDQIKTPGNLFFFLSFIVLLTQNLPYLTFSLLFCVVMFVILEDEHMS